MCIIQTDSIAATKTRFLHKYDFLFDVTASSSVSKKFVEAHI